MDELSSAATLASSDSDTVSSASTRRPPFAFQRHVTTLPISVIDVDSSITTFSTSFKTVKIRPIRRDTHTATQ
jgi:hypothetical protein